MQKVTIKEVIPPRTTKSPIILVTTNGSKISAFAEDGLEGLKEVRAGWVLNVETEVKGRYTNIIAFEVLSRETTEAPKQTFLPDSGYKADPVKLASEELRSRMHAAKDLVIAGVYKREEPMGLLLWDWIMGDKAPKTAPQPPQTTEKDKAFNDTEKLLSRVCEVRGYAQETTARQWIKKKLPNVDDERIDSDPEGVLAEIEPHLK